jgi:hypothetical protein
MNRASPSNFDAAGIPMSRRNGAKWRKMAHRFNFRPQFGEASPPLRCATTRSPSARKLNPRLRLRPALMPLCCICCMGPHIIHSHLPAAAEVAKFPCSPIRATCCLLLHAVLHSAVLSHDRPPASRPRNRSSGRPFRASHESRAPFHRPSLGKLFPRANPSQ